MVYTANKNQRHKYLLYLEGFSHQDFSDAALFGPQWLLKWARSCVQNDSPQNAQDLYSKRTAEFIGELVPEWKSGMDSLQFLSYDTKHVHRELN